MFVSGLFLMPLVVFAVCGNPGEYEANDPYCLREFAGFTGLKPAVNTPLPARIGALVQVVLVFLGVIFFALMVYSGFRWMTSRGNQEVVDEAKQIIENAFIGLIVVLISYALSAFLIQRLFT